MDETERQPKRRSRQAAVLAWMRLARIYHKINTVSARHFRTYDLSPAQFDVLAQIGTQGGMTQQELAGRLLVTKGNISQLMSRMEHNGLIKRCQHGRVNYLYLTDSGRRLREAALPAQNALVTDLLAPLSADEQYQFLALLRKLDKALDNATGE